MSNEWSESRFLAGYKKPRSRAQEIRAEIAEIRRTSRIKKRDLVDRRRRDLREAKAHYKAKGFTRAEYDQEVKEIWIHFNLEMIQEVGYARDMIDAARD